MADQDEVTSSPGPVEPLRLRDRRRRDLRHQLTDAATRMFLEHGFDAVRVSDVARACGVTEKTVYNHFPTKESLLVDRWSPLIAETERVLLSSDAPLVDAVADVLLTELDDLLARPALSDGPSLAELARFTGLTRDTPALVAHERGELERLTTVVAAALTVRGAPGVDPRGPSAWITASALAGLFVVMYRSLHEHVHAGAVDARPADERSRDERAEDERAEGSRVIRLRQAVVDDLHEAADVLRRGI